MIRVGRPHLRLHLQFRRAVGLALALIVLATFGPMSPATRASGHTRLFWMQGVAGPRHARCALEGSTPHADLYACSGAWLSKAQTRALLRTYETVILPTDLSVFGRPRNLTRTDILLAPLDATTLGYFDENDIVPADPAHSNRANVLYVRPPNLMPDHAGVATVEEAIAHEFQHLINFRIRVVDRRLPPQDPWLNEGLAFYAQMVNGFWTKRDELKIQAAARNPDWPVDGLRENSQFLYRHARVAYGRAGLFVTDLVSRYGRAFARSVITARGSGLNGLDSVLRRSRPATTVQAAFAQWGVDLQLNRMPDSFLDTRRASHAVQQELVIAPVTLLPLASEPWRSQNLRIHPWAQQLLQFRATSPGTLHISLSSRQAPLSAAIVARSTHGFAPPRVAWCHPSGSALTAQVDDMGTLYDQATLVVSDTPRIDVPEKDSGFRVSADLVYVGDHNRVSRPTSPARQNPHVSVRKSPHFR